MLSEERKYAVSEISYHPETTSHISSTGTMGYLVIYYLGDINRRFWEGGRAGERGSMSRLNWELSVYGGRPMGVFQALLCLPFSLPVVRQSTAT